ncbi:MAG: glycosyltransferase [Sphingobacteriales bacterium]|nr:MAG: glycosyltransferase [Sphingobacteriales bacterium]
MSYNSEPSGQHHKQQVYFTWLHPKNFYVIAKDRRIVYYFIFSNKHKNSTNYLSTVNYISATLRPSAGKPAAQPLVSVIVPFLDGAVWLMEAIASVINQSYQNWELILVDDGSGPEATQLAKTYSRNFPDKIHYTDHRGHINRG